ncbi:hypothetical protein N7533_003450 [Penicillium manginii]|uniref:uncharacterized protein n=1 Tax=Penicillium manginii TaxID=203109 RepID=UPI002547ADD9|nr:uncharacterized protein N7533_003450 [Penicillium manginii]KAJ5761411.1 hypothetical protein N7533_003450 [Penicillium manginii]
MGDDTDEGYESIVSSTSGQSCTTWAGIQGTLADPREKESKEQVIAKIDALYESGVPFFTKRAIRALSDQLKTKTTPGDKIVTEDLTGASIEWKVKIGKSIELIFGEDCPENRKECVYSEAGVGYRSRSMLKQSLDWYGVEDTAYEPLSLTYRICRLDPNSKTRETIPDDLENIKDRETVTKDFQEKFQAWEESETCAHFKSILSSEVSGHEINKIVGLACGSLALPNNEQATNQTAVLVSVRKWLKEREKKDDISCYIQDPMNTSVDREVLTDIGFEMIDDPRGWLEIDERSVVLSVAPNVPVKEIIADTARPAVVIWNRVPDEDTDSTDPDTARVREMMAGYKLHEFGDEERWADVAIYTRESKVAPVPRADGMFQN